MSIVANPQTGEIQNNSIDSKKELLKRTICKGASDDELELFGMVCKRTGLDPFMKQIYPVSRWDSKLNRNVMTMQTSIDGFRLIAERTGNYCPGREPVHQYDENKRIVSATAFVKKRTGDGTWHEVAATAYYQEYVQKGKEGKELKFWAQMPHLMIAKCAEALALRRAFPAELSGIYTNDEMSQAENSSNTNQIVAPTENMEISMQSVEKIPLTDEQIAKLDYLLLELKDKVFTDRIVEHYKAKDIYDLTQVQFEHSMKRIDAEVKRRNEAMYGKEQMA